MVWSGIYLPRILSNISLMAVGSHQNQKGKESFEPALGYLSTIAFVINILYILNWVNPKMLTSRLFCNSATIVSERSLAAMTLVVTVGQVICVYRSSHQYQQLAMFVLLSCLLLEILHVHVVPSEWKFEPYLQNIYMQDFYILLVFLLDVIALCFIAHLLTQGYVKHVWRNNYKL